MKYLKLISTKAIICYLLLCVGLLSGCKRDYPHHTVAGGDRVVYKTQEVNHKYGKYKYGVTDSSDRGWTLYSDKQYAIGDTIKI